MNKSPKMRLLVVAALVSHGLLMSGGALAYDEAAFLREKALIMQARATGAELQKSLADQRDAAAVSSELCKEVDASARGAAKGHVERGVVVSPANIIQNSTCFGDVFKIKIPVSMTGIGFLDGIISKIGNQLLSSACSQAMGFVNNLKNSAINQISSGVRGALQMDSLDVAGVNVSGIVNGAVGNEVNGAVSGTVNGAYKDGKDLLSNVTNSAPLATSLPTQGGGLFGNSGASGGLFGTQSSGSAGGL